MEYVEGLDEDGFYQFRIFHDFDWRIEHEGASTELYDVSIAFLEGN